MSKAKPESKLQTDIRKAILAEHPGAFVVKIHGNGFQRAGLPDLVGAVEGRYVGIEVKLPGKEDTTTTLQAATLAEIRKAGGIAFVSTSVTDTLDILEEALR